MQVKAKNNYTCPLCNTQSKNSAYIVYGLCCQDSKVEEPNPNDYPDTPEGDQQYFDNYWGNDIKAMIYHQDMGDR